LENLLKKKLKRVHVAKKFFYYLTIVLYAILYAYFIYGILKLAGIENLLRGLIIGFFGIWLVIYILCGLITMISKKTKTFIFITILSLLFCPIFGVSSYYINKIYGSISSINSDTITYTTNLIALKETNFDSNLSIGMISLENDIEGNDLAKKLIEKEKLSNKIELYDDYRDMISDLYAGKIGACFVSSNYAINLSGEDYQDTLSDGTKLSLANRVKVIKEYSEDRKNQDVNTLDTSKKKTLTEPFTVLVMGVDSAINGLKANQAFNGDTLMLITFNPKTLNATMFSIPRDTYVPIACNNNRYAKINSAAAYGTNCVIDTVKQLTDIDIDYYVKVNFKAVVDLVDALDGIDVDVEPPTYKAFYNAYNGRVCEQNSLRQKGEHLVCMDTGMQHLNGEQALAYARCRHAYLLSDIARNKHQQQLIEAIAKRVANPSNINRIEELLNAVTNNLATNMSRNQILSLYDIMKNMVLKSFGDGDFLSIQKTYLEWYNLSVKLSNNGIATSAVGYYPGSLDAIINLMKANLELEEKQVIKTFSFDANENYKTKVTGQGITTGGKLETMPSFIGSSVSEVEAWANERGIVLNKEFVKSLSVNNFSS